MSEGHLAKWSGSRSATFSWTHFFDPSAPRNFRSRPRMLSATRKTTIQHSIASCSYQQSYATAASVAAAQNSGQSRVRNVRHPPAAPNWRPSAPTLSSHPSSSTLASRLTTLKSSPSQNPANRGTRVKALTPFETSQRVAELLLKDNGFDRAVHMVENLPLDAQDVVVWNMLIAEAMTLRKFNRAFELYYDVCRFLSSTWHLEETS